MANREPGGHQKFVVDQALSLDDRPTDLIVDLWAIKRWFERAAECKKSSVSIFHAALSRNKAWLPGVELVVSVASERARRSVSPLPRRPS